jgi:hypothetical protein
MRTTLDIADDVLFAVKETARREGASVGEVMSRLARQALLSSAAAPTGRRKTTVPDTAARLAKFGITPLPHRGGIVTNEMVNRIRDEEGI